MLKRAPVLALKVGQALAGPLRVVAAQVLVQLQVVGHPLALAALLTAGAEQPEGEAQHCLQLAVMLLMVEV